MSNLDKLFEHAPESTTELRENAETSLSRWFNKEGNGLSLCHNFRITTQGTRQ